MTTYSGRIQPRRAAAPGRTTGGRSTRTRVRPRRRGERTGAYLFVAPVLVLTVIFSVIPLVMVFKRSLYSGNVFDLHLKFSGFDNYRDVFRTGGGHALIVTVIYTVGFVVVCMVLGLAIALLLDVRLPGLKQIRAFFIVPLVVPAVATALIWFTLFQPNSGLFNRVFRGVGLPQVTLDNQHTAVVAVITFGAWQFFGEVVILYLAALKGLPQDVLEAAETDGASAWQRLRYVRLPLLRQQTALIVVVATLQGLQTFTQINVLTDGGPQGATQTALYYVYKQGFDLGAAGSSGRADAMAVILFGISLVVAIVQLTIVGRAGRSQGDG